MVCCDQSPAQKSLGLEDPGRQGQNIEGLEDPGWQCQNITGLDDPGRESQITFDLGDPGRQCHSSRGLSDPGRQRQNKDSSHLQLSTCDDESALTTNPSSVATFAPPVTAFGAKLGEGVPSLVVADTCLCSSRPEAPAKCRLQLCHQNWKTRLSCFVHTPDWTYIRRLTLAVGDSWALVDGDMGWGDDEWATMGALMPGDYESDSDSEEEDDCFVGGGDGQVKVPSLML